MRGQSRDCFRLTRWFAGCNAWEFKAMMKLLSRDVKKTSQPCGNSAMTISALYIDGMVIARSMERPWSGGQPSTVGGQRGSRDCGLNHGARLTAMGFLSRPEKPFHIRLAAPADIPALSRLIELSVLGLQAEDYSRDQMEGALGTVFGVDSQLISDGTYFVAEVIDERGESTIAGCGGWSRRKTLFGGDRGAGRNDEPLDPLRDAAKIRAFFVHPAWARRGIGSFILNACEQAAMEAGFKSFEMGATAAGERLYRARGYEVIGRIEVLLANGVSLPVIRMSKRASES